MSANETLEKTKGISVFKILNAIDVNEKKDTKDGLDYLSWADAWTYIGKLYPDSSYKVLKFENNLPYLDSSAGAMVFTEVTIDNKTHEMWLPVMDSTNKAMKKEPYTYKVNEYVYDPKQRKKVATGKKIDKTVEAYTMFDINKTIMRCLVKNIAMFGLGLYIYSKEDLPDVEDVKTLETKEEQILELESLIVETNSDKEKILQFFKVKTLEMVDFDKCKAMLEKKKEKAS